MELPLPGTRLTIQSGSLSQGKIGQAPDHLRNRSNRGYD
jgi:hypothetical protein